MTAIKRITIVLGLVAICHQTATAQQDPMYTHYAFNTLAVNPAYAGSREALTLTALHRSQWVGFDGAPVTQTLTLHSPLLNNKLGLGLTITNDNIGPMNFTSFNVDFAYKIKLSENGTLSLGLKGGGNLLQGELTSLSLDQGGDVAFSQGISSRFLPNFGFGAYYYTPTWYVGLSTPKLLQNTYVENMPTSVSREQRHYYLIAGTVFNLTESEKVKLKPTAFVKVTESAPVEADLTAMFILYDKVELGAMYRTGDALGLLLGYDFTPQLRVGYSYDFSYANKTTQYNGGSHEIMIRYDLVFKNKGKIVSPRYF